MDTTTTTRAFGLGALRAVDGGVRERAGHTEAGVLPDDYFVTGTAATLAGHGQFLNDVAHKQLLWDADGTGAGAAVVVATFATPQTNLHAHDILLV